jgi:phenylacetate-CoA ligase
LAVRNNKPAFYDRLETRSPRAREAALFAALPAHLAHARRKAPGWRRILQEVDPRAVSSR